MKKQVMQTITFFGVVLALCFATKLSAEAHTTGQLVEEDGKQYLYSDGQKVINDFVFDGTYTYYAQADGTPMKDRLTYHPDGEHIIYFDEYGHEVFSYFQYCSEVEYTCYFDCQGYIYKDQITFVDDKVYYLNANGAMEQSGWFQFANGRDYGFANWNGVLESNGFSWDTWGRIVYYHWNGMVARGLITDGNDYYSFDINDGHYLGKFPTGNPNPLYGPNTYIVGVNIPVGEYFLFNNGEGVEFAIFAENGKKIREDRGGQNLIFTVSEGQILYINDGIATADLASQQVDTTQRWLNAKIGVHLQPGVYQIMSAGSYYSGNAYYELWTDASFLSDVADSYYFDYTGECVTVRVSEGQLLTTWNAYITYLGP
ncbi:hypothetical protein [Roseburia sp. 499]|uniref:hypothetical protein n=1 Tax=Roseburia sp. 499 TaxID=1261634 RepID=UPI0009531254|nr:hypothetical protein [Roseburia sp. 499]WVK69286.1 hypothetical protein BIV20_13110 [Roseburia sp. 499]